MTKTALLFRLDAKEGKEEEVAKLLGDALVLAKQESATVAWFALRVSHSTFGIFDAFADELGRQAHLHGKVSALLKDKTAALLVQSPVVEQVEVLGVKSASERESTPKKTVLPSRRRSREPKHQAGDVCIFHL